MSKIRAEAFEELRRAVEGETLLPGEEPYEQARQVWNAMIDRKPAAIVRCLGSKDVAEAVSFARRHGLLLAVKGGGHNVAGNAVCDGGLMIDLSSMRSVDVDPSAKTARVQGGCLLEDVDRATQRHGLAVSAGIVSHTGVAGLTLGGGFGWISRKHGLTVDNLLSAEIVTADGEILTVNEKSHPDLFWGIRGGGGNFGVATSFEFRAADIGTEVYSGLVVHRFEKAREYIQFHREYVRTLPDEMTVWMVIRKAPPLPFLPTEVHGSLVVVVPFAFLGDPEEGETLVRPILEFAPPHGSAIGRNPWVGWQSGFDQLNAHGARNYWKSHHIENLSDGCIDRILEAAEAFPSPHCEVFIPHMEGAPARVPEDTTAFAFRRTPFVLNVHTRWERPADDARCIGWARDLFESTRPFAHGVYVNFLSDEGGDRVRDAYSPETWTRLARLKKRYDPTNLFRMNQNIQPEGS